MSTAAVSIINSKNFPQHIQTILQAHGTSLGEIKSKWKTLAPKAMLTSLRNIYWLFKDLYYYSKFNKVVAIGDSVFNDLKRFPMSCVLPEKKVHLVRNGIDDKLFFPDERLRKELRQSLGLNPNTRVVISASRLHRQKGVHYALKAFAEYAERNPDVYYLILGDGPERLKLEHLARQLKVDKMILFQGAVRREQLNQYLAAADVFLFTTMRAEGLPLNILEALAAGLPVIGSKHLEGVVDVAEGVYGVDPADVAGVAGLMERVVENRGARGSLLPDCFRLRSCVEGYYEIF